MGPTTTLRINQYYNEQKEGEFIAMFGVHLPVLFTLNHESAFPFSTGNRGAGLVPKVEQLESYLHSVRESLTLQKEKPWKQSLQDRLSTIEKVYSTPENLAKKCYVDWRFTREKHTKT